MVKVKICGIRDEATALAAISGGADFLGFNFVPGSRRYVEPERAKAIIHSLGCVAAAVGVFQDAPIETVNDLVLALGLDFVQLHGDEDVSYASQVKAPVIKAIRLSDAPIAEVLTGMRQYPAVYFLLDRAVQGRGGMIDIGQARLAAQEFPVLIAGGLNAGNVAGVIRATQPDGVDVAGGVETGGQPDADQLRSFIGRAKDTNGSTSWTRA